MAEFQFTPIDGFKNATSFPNPSTEAEARAQLQSLLDQLRDAYNVLNSITDGASGADNVRATPISTSPNTVQGILEWLNEQINAIVQAGISDGSVTDAKLSSLAGNIKARYAAHAANTSNPHSVTTAQIGAISASEKGVAYGIASLDADGKLTKSQVNLRDFEAVNGYSPSTVLFTNTGAPSGQTTTPVKKFEVKLNTGGTLRVTFKLYTSSGGTAYGRIYKNGVPIGTLQSTTSSGSAVTFTEELAGFAKNDLLQLYLWCADGVKYSFCQDISISGTTRFVEQTL